MSDVDLKTALWKLMLNQHSAQLCLSLVAFYVTMCIVSSNAAISSAIKDS